MSDLEAFSTNTKKGRVRELEGIGGKWKRLQRGLLCCMTKISIGYFKISPVGVRMKYKSVLSHAQR